jgi:hypothetical protein
MFSQFLLGTILGAGVVGSSVHRTISVEHGDIKGCLISSILNSVSYFFSVWAIANDNYAGYLGTAVGSTICVLIMARRNKK